MVTTLEYLLQKAVDNGISVYELSLENIQSMIADLKDMDPAICLSSSGISSSREAAELMAHELGHFFTGTYYDSPYCANNRGKMEHKANTWMVKELLPFASLREALKDSCHEYWEIAEYCNCTENLVETAIQIYQQKGLL